MPVERKTFRIEEMSRGGFTPAEPADEAALRHAEIMAALASLRALMTASGPHNIAESAGQTGTLAPVRDVVALASACEALLGRQDRRIEMGKAGRAFVVEQFAPSRIRAGVLGIYAELGLSPSRGPS